MPIFYIKRRFVNETISEDEGTDFPSLQEAKAAAFASAQDIVARNTKCDTDTLLREVLVTDQGGRQLATIKIIRASP